MLKFILKICQLHLQEGGLHADINGDGVLDHVQVVPTFYYNLRLLFIYYNSIQIHIYESASVLEFTEAGLSKFRIS